jgi:hypothetical protein
MMREHGLILEGARMIVPGTGPDRSGRRLFAGQQRHRVTDAK